MVFSPTLLGAKFKLYAACLVVALLVVSACTVISEKEHAASPKILTVWSAVDYTSDPLDAKSTEYHFLSSLENRTLFGLTNKGKIRDEIATSYEVSGDALTITVNLSDTTFSDGAEIVSSDVKASLSRLVRKNSDYAKILRNVKGFGEAKNGGDFFGIETKRNQSVVFKLIAPDPSFVYHLAHPATAILPAASISTEGSLTSNVHSGFYSTKIINNELNAVTVFEPRDDSLPTINVVRKAETEIISKPIAQDVDIVLAATARSMDFLQKSVPQLAIASWNIYVKNAESPFSDIRFRKAILLAMDEKEAIAAYSTKAFTPKRFAGDTFDSVTCSLNCKTDTNKAAELIKDIYGLGQVPSITIDIENNEIQQALAKSAVKQLETIGVKAQVRAHSVAELSNAIARGEVQLFRFGWISDVAIGSEQLVSNYKADSTDNVSGLTDATLEDKIAKYQNSTTESEQLTASHELQERLKDLWLTRPVAQFHKIVTVEKNIENLKFDYYGRASIKDIRISS